MQFQRHKHHVRRNGSLLFERGMRMQTRIREDRGSVRRLREESKRSSATDRRVKERTRFGRSFGSFVSNIGCDIRCIFKP